MKKPKTVKPFFFKELSHQEMADKLNDQYPIDLKYNEDLINRIHSKYPLLNKLEISIVVKSVFRSLRNLLILGDILNFNKLFFDTKLFVFPHRKKNVIFPSVKIKISTPPPLRKNDK